MHQHLPRRRPALAGLLALAVAVPGLLGTTVAAADAAPSRPAGLKAVGEVAAGLPVLSWRASSGAVSYQVQLDDDETFASPTFSVSTTNVAYAWTKVVPPGTQFWRVRAVDEDRRSSSWATEQLSVSRTPAPTSASPADGAVLAQPADPPLLEWSVAPGAESYVVQLDDEDGFADPTEYETGTTSLVVPDPLSPGKDYFWRVKAVRSNGVESSFSTTRDFQVGPLAVPEVLSPDSSATNDLTDVVLDWEPVPGARYYELQVSTDDDFADATIIDSRTKLTGTRYSPRVTYDNNQYYWRVRAVSSDSTVKSDWSPAVNQFRRSWNDQPEPVYPLSSSENVSDPFFYEWTPVAHASTYQLQTSTSPAFDIPDETDLCVTAGTTFVPGTFKVNDPTSSVRPLDLTGCLPTPGVTTYWRVRPFDQPFNLVGVQGLFSQTQSFVYQPRDFVPQDSGDLFSPAPDATVDVPTLRWTPDVDAEQYAVSVKDASGATVASVTTYASSYTPPRELKPADGPFTWSVRAIEANGAPGSLVYSSRFRTSGSLGAGSPLQATEGDESTTTRTPALAWGPQPGAAYYRVRTFRPGTSTVAPGDSELAATKLFYPAATYAKEAFLRQGDYEWQVTAYDSGNSAIGVSPRYTFHIAGLDPVAGQRLALGGEALRTDEGCGARIGATPSTCADLPATPTLGWDPVPGASFYMVYVGQDDKFTNMLELAATPDTFWTPSDEARHPAFPDSQAGSAYFWFVRPCKSVLECGSTSPISVTPSVATGRFSKKSPAITGGTATDETGLDGTEVTFTWDDYRDTNATTAWAAADGLSAPSTQSALLYRLEVSRTPSFGTLLESVDVDQPTYTSTTRLYPDGPVYWRVRAVDGAGNDLTRSPVYQYDKAGDPVTLLSPSGSDQTTGTVALRWRAQAYSQAYEVQVAGGNDVNFSADNLLFSEETSQTAFTWDRPVPASTTSYVWRVRRIDAIGNKGVWSSPRRFSTPGIAPTQTTPRANAVFSGTNAFFYWSLVPDAATYRFEQRTGSRVTSITTAANAQAPTAGLPTGSREWRVVSLDADGKPLGVTPWRAFRVDATRPTIVKRPPSTMSRRASFKVTFSERVTGASTSTISLVRNGTSTRLPVRVSISSDRRTVTVTPSRTLAARTSYDLRLTSGIRDALGNRLRPATIRVRTTS